MRDPLSLVEAAYRLKDPTSVWLKGVLDAFAGVLGLDYCGVGALFDCGGDDYDPSIEEGYR